MRIENDNFALAGSLNTLSLLYMTEYYQKTKSYVCGIHERCICILWRAHRSCAVLIFLSMQCYCTECVWCPVWFSMCSVPSCVRLTNVCCPAPGNFSGSEKKFIFQAWDAPKVRLCSSPPPAANLACSQQAAQRIKAYDDDNDCDDDDNDDDEEEEDGVLLQPCCQLGLQQAAQRNKAEPGGKDKTLKSGDAETQKNYPFPLKTFSLKGCLRNLCLSICFSRHLDRWFRPSKKCYCVLHCRTYKMYNGVYSQWETRWSHNYIIHKLQHIFRTNKKCRFIINLDGCFVLKYSSNIWWEGSGINVMITTTNGWKLITAPTVCSD